VNQRHKVGLFITAIGAGLCLLVGTGFRETCGIILLGLAFAWAFGSSNRILRLCLAGIGLTLLLHPVTDALWSQYKAKHEYNEKLAAFEKQLPQLAREHPDLSAGFVAQPVPKLPPGAILMPQTRTFPIPNVGNVQFPIDSSSKEIAEALRHSKDKGVPPQWYFNALDAGIDAEKIDGLDSPGWLEVPPSISGRIKADYLEEGLGAILIAMFLGSLIADARRGHLPPVS
jgi:hypothetical protein